ncbi:helix-turn-helix transcriptional regulator [Mucilaginibacter sp. UR6-1]|uniref:helix-turn-helix transcriptional regulator n=1 Tax=Mucilaginibacter sp. UR6-1 TaxID=1435643 RepID=UPI001E532962|nr:helix-turn-helix transcriptional regulator [Mucilaginibacter sp. UR6-1]MCC8409144.1 helix-turn-helix transcriptional regulator [Mucilaginibacter sp. UR6-1]
MGTLAELEKHIWMPDHLQRQMGQFNVFAIDNTPGNYVNCQPYNRKGFYKISLLKGHTRLFYADKDLEFKESGLLFSNPYVPYSWEHLGNAQTGFYCIFTEAFFDEHYQMKDYPVFKPGNNALFELSATEVIEISSVFRRMQEEIDTDFVYKYDVLRNLTLDLIYKALKMQPAKSLPGSESNGSVRVAALFTELLERQFPIESTGQRIRLRFPSEYADHLSVHINHLNRSLKKVTGQTTSQLIAARVMQEARILLQHTDWNISEISWCLGFEELPHFINFFKKNAVLTPKHFRNNH